MVSMIHLHTLPENQGFVEGEERCLSRDLVRSTLSICHLAGCTLYFHKNVLTWHF